MKQSISFITLAVSDFEQELAFYRDTLGWVSFTVVEGTIAFFKVGELVFSLCAYDELRQDVGQDLTMAPPLGVTLALNLPDEKSVDSVFSELKAAGASILKEPVRASWGGYSGYFQDPEGHLWEVAFNPQFQYGADGTMIVPD